MKVRVKGWYPKPGYEHQDVYMLNMANFQYTAKDFESSELYVFKSPVLISSHGLILRFFLNKTVMAVTHVDKPYEFFYIRPEDSTAILVAQELDLKDPEQIKKNRSLADIENEKLKKAKEEIKKQYAALERRDKMLREARRKAILKLPGDIKPGVSKTGRKIMVLPKGTIKRKLSNT